VRAQTTPPVRRLLDALSGAGPRVDDAVRTAADVTAAGCLVALEHTPAPDGTDAADELRELVDRVAGAGLAGACELTVPVDRLGAAAPGVVRAAAGAGLDVALDGDPAAVDALAAAGGSVTVVVRATDPGAEERCRALAAGRVRLTGGRLFGRRGAAADLAFVRCLDVLMSAPGHPGVGSTDPRLVAIAGERAAWNERAPDSWEYVMPWQVRREQQRRLVAGGYRVRVVLRSGRVVPPPTPATAPRRPAGRS
jgi:proline dehydrogenase